MVQSLKFKSPPLKGVGGCCQFKVQDAHRLMIGMVKRLQSKRIGQAQPGAYAQNRMIDHNDIGCQHRKTIPNAYRRAEWR